MMEHEDDSVHHSPGEDHHQQHDSQITVNHCKDTYHDDDFVSDVLNASSPYLYAFIVEFSLVGGTVFFNTWNNVKMIKAKEAKERFPNSSVQKPNLCEAIAKVNWSDSAWGVLGGTVILFFTIFDLIAFFSVDYEEDVIF